MDSRHQNYDAIVVGSGPGGATVAKELSERGRRVLILEWGGNAPVTGTSAQFTAAAGVPGKSVLFTPDMLATVRGITTGGSSLFYYATAFDPPLEMLSAHGLDIASEVEEAKHELPIAPLADDLMGPMAERLMSSACELGYDWQKLPKLVYQDKCRKGCWRCNYGCPYAAKWSARMFVEDAVGNGAVLTNHARVTKVIVENGKAVGVDYVCGRESRRAFADDVIVAAGGIGSPVILRASGLAGAGYDFFFDPLIVVMGAVDGIDGGKEFPMASGIHMKEEGYLMTDMTMPALLYMGFTAQALRFDKLLAHSRTLCIMIKAKDELSGAITDKGGVRKRLPAEDKEKLSKGYSRAEEILKHAGARDVYRSRYVAAHPGGSVKVGDLLDSDLKTEYDNLYVCDCSALPEAWGLPPTLTLIGLGKRLAKHLASEEEAVEPAAAELHAVPDETGQTKQSA